MAKRPKQTANNDTPTCTFRLMRQKWRRLEWAVRKSGFKKIADAILNRIEGIRPTDLVEIEVPISACIAISQACATHGVDGIAFATAASAHLAEKVPVKPVPSEAMAEALENAKAELEGMEL